MNGSRYNTCRHHQVLSEPLTLLKKCHHSSISSNSNCNSIYISCQQLAKVSTNAKLFVIYLDTPSNDKKEVKPEV